MRDFTKADFYRSFINSRESLHDIYFGKPLQLQEKFKLDPGIVKKALEDISQETEKLLTTSKGDIDFRKITKNSEKCAILLNLMKAAERRSRCNSRLTRIADAVAMQYVSAKKDNIYDTVIKNAGETDLV